MQIYYPEYPKVGRRMRVEPRVDNRAYQIGVINSNRLEDHPVLEIDKDT